MCPFLVTINKKYTLVDFHNNCKLPATIAGALIKYTKVADIVATVQ